MQLSDVRVHCIPLLSYVRVCAMLSGCDYVNNCGVLHQDRCAVCALCINYSPSRRKR